MEIAALIISIIALLVTGALTLYQIVLSKKINDINLDSELLRNIVSKYITENIPNAYSDICYPQGKLSGTNKLQETLNDLVKELRFFKFYDKTFFDEIKDKCQELEDYVVENDGHHYEIDEINKVSNQITDSISGIYTILKRKYRNG